MAAVPAVAVLERAECVDQEVDRTDHNAVVDHVGQAVNMKTGTVAGRVGADPGVVRVDPNVAVDRVVFRVHVEVPAACVGAAPTGVVRVERQLVHVDLDPGVVVDPVYLRDQNHVVVSVEAALCTPLG
jgi:hypothetical protein